MGRMRWRDPETLDLSAAASNVARGGGLRQNLRDEDVGRAEKLLCGGQVFVIVERDDDRGGIALAVDGQHDDVINRALSRGGRLG